MTLRLAIVTLAVCLAASPALAAVKVERPWARPAPPGLPSSAAYMTIRNTGRTPQTLVAVSSPAARASLHQSMDRGGMMSMQPMGPVTAPPGGAITLQPGGLHVMLEGLKRPLKTGDHLPLRLRFLNGPSLQVDAVVRATAP